MRKLAWIGALLIGMTVPMQAFASSPEFARTTEEWTKLRDNTLEYDEIEDLVHEYNPTVQSNQYTYRKFREDYGDTNDEVANAYRDLADDFYSSMSGEDDAGSMVSDLNLQTQAKNMLTQADNSLEDSKIYLLTYEQTEKNLVVSAQSNMISWYRDQLTLKSDQLELEQAQRNQQLTQTRQTAGTVTSMELLDDQNSVITAEAAIQEQERTIQSVKEKLLVSLGWAYNADASIGDLPEVDVSEIDTMNPDQDLEQALENNYTLRINERKLENAVSQTTKDSLVTTIANNKKQIAVSLSAAYQKVQSSRLSYEQALTAQALAQQNTRVAEAKRSAGMMTDRDYQQQVKTLETSNISVDSAKLDLLEAMETYRWSVKGLASAE